MSTGIFSTSRKRRDVDLSMSPELERRYRPALSAMDRAFDKAGADDPKVVVEAVMAVPSARRPNPRAVVGKGTGMLLMLSSLPIRARPDGQERPRSHGSAQTLALAASVEVATFAPSSRQVATERENAWAALNISFIVFVSSNDKLP